MTDAPWLAAFAGLMLAPLFAFLGVWYQTKKTSETAQKAAKATVDTATLQINADSQKTARQTSIEVTESLLNRLYAANEALTARLEAYEAKVTNQATELSQLNRRIGSLEGDNARLAVENESLRKEIERLANEVQHERAEKYTLTNENAATTARLNEAVRERIKMEKRVDDLEREVARLRACISGGERRSEPRSETPTSGEGAS